MTPEQIKTVFEMSEEELELWLIKNEIVDGAILQCKDGGEKPCGVRESLADLAFRLRDEAEKKSPLAWHSGLFDVYMIVKGPGHRIYNWRWASSEAQPKHWILAAMQAKKNTDGNNSS